MIVSMISLGYLSKPFSGEAGVADSDNWVTSVMAKVDAGAPRTWGLLAVQILLC